MEVNSVEFVASYPRESACPKEGTPEFAFIGRSNVGKSSLINMLTRKGMAKVSATPGKTQLLNYFLINKKWFLVDLPGYGYAKVSKTKQQSLAKMISGYFVESPGDGDGFCVDRFHHSAVQSGFGFYQWPWRTWHTFYADFYQN